MAIAAKYTFGLCAHSPIPHGPAAEVHMDRVLPLVGKIVQNKFLYVMLLYYIYTMQIKPDTKALMTWAKKKLGPSKCKRIKLVNRPKSDWIGIWDWNGTITINMAKIGYRKKLYRILAHEWTHAQQYWRDYKKHLYTHSYWQHPLEMDARCRERTMEWRMPTFCKMR